MKAGANVTNKISELSYNFAKIYNTCWLKNFTGLKPFHQCAAIL